MKKYCFITAWLLIGATVSSCNLSSKQKEKPGEGVAQRPNIVYILADDLGYGDLSCYGQTHFATPHLDKLATEGMMFTQHYAGSTVCAPSRSALMTGLHTGHTPVRGNKEVRPEGQWPMPDATFTMAEMLKKEGYVTGAFGKWGLGYPGSEGDPNHQGFDEFYGYNCQRIAHNYYPYHMWNNQQKEMLPGNAGKKTETYGPAIIHQHALRFLEANYQKPFFLYYASTLAHAELAAPKSYIDKYKGKLEPEKSYKGVDDGPNYKNGGYGSQPTCHAAFAGMVNYLDDQVGELMDKLKELGVDQNTIVIFSSDNGPHREGGADPEYFDSNGIFRGFKRDLYEGGIREPMIVRWPGKVAAGSHTDHISAFWDVMPTLADIVGAEKPAPTDGISILPTLTGQGTQQTHPYLYWEFHERGGRLALRQGDWKIVQYQVNKTPGKAPELYNLKNDPSETHDLAGEYPDKLQALKELMIHARTPSTVFTFKSKAYDGSK